MLDAASARPFSAQFARRVMRLAECPACSGPRSVTAAATASVPAGCRRLQAARRLQIFQSKHPKRSEGRKGRFGCWKQARLASVRRVYPHGRQHHQVYRRGRQQDRVYHRGCAPDRFDRHPYRQECCKGSRRTAPRRIQASRRPTLFAARSVASVDDRIRSSSYVARCRMSLPPHPSGERLRDLLNGEARAIPWWSIPL
jgi:hypothetical protein